MNAPETDKNDRFPYVIRCHHVAQHEIRIDDTVEEFALWMFREEGWEQAGWCLAYMPGWLHPKFEVTCSKNAKI